MSVERRSFKGVRVAYVVETEWQRTIVTPMKDEVCFEVHKKESDGRTREILHALFKREGGEAEDALEAFRTAVVNLEAWKP